MAVQVVCDGCTTPVAPAAGVPVGDLDPVVYCAACAGVWAAVTARIDADRVTAVTTFETARAARLAAARTALAKLPDDPEGGD